MAKKQSKSGSKKKKRAPKKPQGAKIQAPKDSDFSSTVENDYGDVGTMGSLLGGFKRAVGAPGDERAQTWKDHVWAVGIFLLLLGLIAFALSSR